MVSVRELAVLLSVCTVLLFVAPAGGADRTTEFTITVPGSIDTPTRQIALEGEEFEVSGVGRVTAGETLLANVTAPNDAIYDVYLYDADRKIVSTVAADGDTTAGFETGDLSVGSYVLAVYVDGTFRTIHPVVVSGYALRLDAPSTATQDDELSVTVSVTSMTSSGSPSRVDVALVGGSVEREVTATDDGDTYRATLSLADVPTGTYQLYAAARGDDTAYGRTELVGISDAQRLDVTAGGESAPGESPSATATPTPNSSTTNDSTTRPTSIAAPQTPVTTPSSTVRGSYTASTPTTDLADTWTTAAATDYASESTTDGAVLSPNEQTTTESGGQPGFTAAAAIVAVLAAALLGLRSRR